MRFVPPALPKRPARPHRSAGVHFSARNATQRAVGRCAIPGSSGALAGSDRRAAPQVTARRQLAADPPARLEGGDQQCPPSCAGAAAEIAAGGAVRRLGQREGARSRIDEFLGNLNYPGTAAQEEMPRFIKLPGRLLFDPAPPVRLGAAIRSARRRFALFAKRHRAQLSDARGRTPAPSSSRRRSTAAASEAPPFTAWSWTRAGAAWFMPSSGHLGRLSACGQRSVN